MTVIFFGKKPKKGDFRELKKIKIDGVRLTIRKLNPLLDFERDRMPQIFTSFISRRPIKEEPIINEAQVRKQQEDMQAVVKAGLVEPELVPVDKNERKGKEEGVTIDDIFANINFATKLYIEILTHSLNQFKGLKGLFFYHKTKRLFYTSIAKHMALNQ